MTAGLIALLGGIGLFLLGMRLMTDGLTASAGGGLRTILAGATRSRGRALGSGLLITTGVQSSSAVIFATIGFVNTGLLSLGQAIGLVYGANLGTTLTSWLVAVAGFNLNLRALALPAIGVGAIAWAISRASRWGALGQAAAGFGLFFLGIDVLRDAFDGLGGLFPIGGQDAEGSTGIAIFVLSGIAITLLTQSSSATLAITLTAAAGGLVPVQAAAAMIIGANVGATSTAVFAAIGATSPARRVAAAHVLFNVVTAVLALALLPVLLWAAQRLAGVLGSASEVPLALAVFHTLTKLLGVAAMWPLTSRVVAGLERRFRTPDEDQARPRHLDANLLATPALALDALGMELQRMGTMAAVQCTEALGEPRPAAMEGGHQVMESLQAAVGEYAARLHHLFHDSVQDARLPDALRVAQYHVNMTEMSVELARLRPETRLEHGASATLLRGIRDSAAVLLKASASAREDRGAIDMGRLLEQFETGYQHFKSTVLEAGSTGEMPPRRMAAVLEYGSALRRMCNQASKATAYLDRYLDTASTRGGDAGAPEPALATTGREG